MIPVLRTMRRPFTGAWIETRRSSRSPTLCSSRPFTGAWIETWDEQQPNPASWVAPSQGRGLKRSARGPRWRTRGRPFTGAWIETPRRRTPCGRPRVAPSQGRGLKHDRVGDDAAGKKVAPSQGRGLKRFEELDDHALGDGRPFTGAWIETSSTSPTAWLSLSPLHRGVD